MTAVIPPLPLYAFMPCIEATLAFNLEQSVYTDSQMQIAFDLEAPFSGVSGRGVKLITHQ